jgi:hypothetical protein
MLQTVNFFAPFDRPAAAKRFHTYAHGGRLGRPDRRAKSDWRIQVSIIRLSPKIEMWANGISKLWSLSNMTEMKHFSAASVARQHDIALHDAQRTSMTDFLIVSRKCFLW